MNVRWQSAFLVVVLLAGCLGFPAHGQECGFPQFAETEDHWFGPELMDSQQGGDQVIVLQGNATATWIVQAQLSHDNQQANGTQTWVDLPANVTVWGSGPSRIARSHMPPTDAVAQSTGVQVLHADGACWIQDDAVGAGAITVKQSPGKQVAAGQGAHVFYAGFWENGTLFETNIKGFDQSNWPRAGWYESAPYDPLPVYVYDQARSEEPAYWKPLPGTPPTGTPVDGPLSTAISAPGLGYYSTIKGFNDGLKGLSTTSARAIHMNATDAYPEGTPNNPLAGDNLVFYVYLQDVVDQPCPAIVPANTQACHTST